MTPSKTITSKTLDAQIYALHKHRHQVYEEGTPGIPYSVHLIIVNTQVIKYLHLLPEELWEIVIMAAWLHDVREDLGVSYNEIKKRYGIDVAEVVYCLTNFDGRTRKEKAINTYGPKTSTNRLAVYDKLADRLGNVLFGILNGGTSSMLKTQAEEFDYMVEILFVPGEYDEMWNDLADMLKKPRPTEPGHQYKMRGNEFFKPFVSVQPPSNGIML